MKKCKVKKVIFFSAHLIWLKKLHRLIRRTSFRMSFSKLIFVFRFNYVSDFTPSLNVSQCLKVNERTEDTYIGRVVFGCFSSEKV